MKKKKSSFLFSIVFILLVLNSFKIISQESIVFEKLNFENNDIQSIVYGISEDDYGNVWFATEEGVIRYNSKETYLYDINKGLPNGISNRVYSIIKDRKGVIWIGSTNGIAFYNNKKDLFENISNNDIKLESQKRINRDLSE